MKGSTTAPPQPQTDQSSQSDQMHNPSQGSPLQRWLSPHSAASYLGVTLDALLPLVETGQITVHRALDHGLLFHLDDLDAVLLPVPPSEAARLLAAEVSSTPGQSMTPSEPTASPPPTPSTLVSLKEATVPLNMPYKALLRLVHAGKIPVTNLGTTSRPRFMVDPEALKRLWADNAQRDMRQRSAPVASLDFSRLLSQTRTRSRKAVPHG